MRTLIGLSFVLLPAIAAAQPHRKAVAEQAPLPVEERPTVTIAGGASRGVADGLGAMPAMRAEVWLPAGLTVAITASSKDATMFRETATAALVGYRVAVVRGGFAAWAGAEAGGGLVIQTPAQSSAAYSGAAIAAPVVGASLRITRQVALALDAAVPAAVIRRDGATTIVALPAAWLGVRMEL